MEPVQLLAILPLLAMFCMFMTRRLHGRTAAIVAAIPPVLDSAMYITFGGILPFLCVLTSTLYFCIILWEYFTKTPAR